MSRVDVRIQVKIPGSVECHAVDLKGVVHSIKNPAVWTESYVSSVLRSFVDNDEMNPLLGLRKMDPLSTLKCEQRFLEAAESEFWKGFLVF
jgi:hypothetical protein